MSANLSVADMDYFLADRQVHGFNAMWADILCGPYTAGRRDDSTYDGIVPFTTTGDISTPNPAYFARIDTMVQLAEKRGFTLLLQPAETGSFKDLLRSNGPTKDFNYGVFLGKRYRKYPNIIWLSGNDYQTNQWKSYDSYTTAVSRGLRSADPNRLQTIELNFYISLSTDNPNWASIVDLNAAYTYFPTYDEVLKGYNQVPTKPVFLIEANYEGDGSDEALRRQEYWTILSGGTGALYGSHYTWSLRSRSWRQKLDTLAASQVGYMKSFFTALPWSDLVPDQSHRLLIAGYGTYTTHGHVDQSDYATAAMTADGSLGVVYLPTAQTITIDTRRFSGPVTARWYDPTNGTFQTVAGSPFANSSTRHLTPPRHNGEGSKDWVLALTAASNHA